VVAGERPVDRAGVGDGEQAREEATTMAGAVTADGMVVPQERSAYPRVVARIAGDAPEAATAEDVRRPARPDTTDRWLPGLCAAIVRMRTGWAA
jgi:hypothetical protein